MRAYFQNFKNLLKLTFFPIVSIIGATILFLFFFILFELTFVDGSYSKYNWTYLVSFILVFIITLFVFRHLSKLFTTQQRNDDKITLNISFYVVCCIICFFFYRVAKEPFLKFINRDKSPKIVTINDLLENAEDMQGREFSLSAFDTSFTTEVNDMVKNSELKWQLYTNKNGRFRVHFPNGKILEKTRTQIIDNKTYNIHTSSIDFKDKIDFNKLYQIVYFKISPEISNEELFEQQKRYLLSVCNGTLENEFIIDSLGYPARELYFIIDEKDFHSRTRMIIANNMFYQVTVITEKGNLFNRAINEFINSFRPI